MWFDLSFFFIVLNFFFRFLIAKLIDLFLDSVCRFPSQIPPIRSSCRRFSECKARSSRSQVTPQIPFPPSRSIDLPFDRLLFGGQWLDAAIWGTPSCSRGRISQFQVPHSHLHRLVPFDCLESSFRVCKITLCQSKMRGFCFKTCIRDCRWRKKPQLPGEVPDSSRRRSAASNVTVWNSNTFAADDFIGSGRFTSLSWFFKLQFWFCSPLLRLGFQLLEWSNYFLFFYAFGSWIRMPKDWPWSIFFSGFDCSMLLRLGFQL